MLRTLLEYTSRPIVLSDLGLTLVSASDKSRLSFPRPEKEKRNRVFTHVCSACGVDTYLFYSFVEWDCSKIKVFLSASPSSFALTHFLYLLSCPFGKKYRNLVGHKLVPESRVISIIIRRTSLCRIQTLKVTISDPPRETGTRLRVSTVSTALDVSVL